MEETCRRMLALREPSEHARSDQTLRFTPSAYLQRLLGRELLSSDYAAAAELVKNSYDAGATEVTITLHRETPQMLVISDNGSGMSLPEFEQFWMSPGYSEKADIGGIEVNNETRILLGEKGIGRFAADKLAARLTVVTKKVGAEEALWVEFDWNQFDAREKKIWEIPVEYHLAKHPELAKYHSGTILQLTDLRRDWTVRDWRRLRKELQNIVNPNRSPQNFRILAIANGWESGPVQSPFEAQTGYHYEFTLSRGGNMTWRFTRPKEIATVLPKPVLEQGRGHRSNTFGTVSGRFHYVDKPQPLIKLGFEPGIGLYRDGFRVEPYGRSADDWLQVHSFKASRQGHAPTPSRLFGFVEISRNKNPDLRDITSREGLQDTPEFLEFRDAVIERYRHFAELLESDKSALDVEVPQLVGQRAQATRQLRAEAFTEMATKLAHQLRQPLGHIRMSATNLRDVLESQGLLNQDVAMLTDMIDQNVIRMNENIDYLYRLAKGLKEEAEDIDLCKFAQHMVDKHKDNFRQMGVQLSLAQCTQGSTVKFGRLSLEFIIDNFLTNAMRATLATTKESRVVTVQVDHTEHGFHLSVTDNGDGIPPEFREAIFKDYLPGSHEHLGMGLWWSQAQAKENGAECQVMKSDKEGTTVSITF